MISNFVKNKKDNKGITLISLVITIVIMLILTGITINLLFGENGIITKTKMAKKAFLGEDAREVVEDRVNAYITEYGSKGELDLFDFWAMYNSSELLDASGNSTGQANPNYDPNFVIYLFEEEAAVNFTPSVQTGVYDKNTPYLSAVVIYKGYSVTLDKKLGVKGKATAIEDLTEAQVSKLENKQIYTITPTGWAKQKTITPGEIAGSELYIDVNASGVKQSMTKWDYPITVTENKTGANKLNYEVRTGTNTDTGTIEVDKIETTPPTVSTDLTGTVNGRTIQLSVGVQDADSGIDHVIFEHKSSTSTDYKNQTTVDAETAGLTTAQTINATLGSQQSPMSDGTYNIRAKVYDVAGNEYITAKIDVEIESGGTANAPEISQGMVPVKWNGSNWVVCSTANTNNEWYNYGTQWANVMLMDGLTVYNSGNSGAITAVTNSNLSSMTGKTVVRMGSMFVWIPRYEYKITPTSNTTPSNTNAGTIGVKFIEGKSTSASSGYTIHPAFRNDVNNGGWTDELKGIWVAKFEASNSSCTTDKSTGQYTGTDRAVRVVPGVTSWRNLTIGYCYEVCQKMRTSYSSTYGISSTESTIAPHLMKNSEWGAVAYLTHSKYGRNGTEVWINNSSSYITGSCSTLSAYDTTYDGTTTTTDYKVGTNASTTGNIYGIYDMSGGAYDFVAAYEGSASSNKYRANTDNTNSSVSSNNFAFTTGGSAKNSTKYATKYANGSSTEPSSPGCKVGDATYEVYVKNNKAWFKDNSTCAYASLPFFERGGSCSSGSSTGVFSACGNSGTGQFYDGFRPVLVVE